MMSVLEAKEDILRTATRGDPCPSLFRTDQTYREALEKIYTISVTEEQDKWFIKHGFWEDLI